MTDPTAAAPAVSAGPSGAHIGAFFDVDGTLVDGFTAVPHAGHRIRRRQARIGEVLGVIEAATRYRLGRMEFERLVVRAAGYLRGESLAELDLLGPTCSPGGSNPGCSRRCATSWPPTSSRATPW